MYDFLQIPIEEQCSVHVNMRALIAGARAKSDDIASCESQSANRTLSLSYDIPMSDSNLLGQLETWHERNHRDQESVRISEYRQWTASDSL